MKKLIKSSVESDSYFNYSRGRQEFGIHMYNDDPVNLKFQVTEIHPYDEASYTWARCGYKGSGYVEFIKNGKVIDSMKMHSYDEDDYESEDEYVNDVIDQICAELRHSNKGVEPRIDHT